MAVPVGLMSAYIEVKQAELHEIRGKLVPMERKKHETTLGGAVGCAK